MKKLVTLIATLLMAAGIAFAADPCTGYWISHDEKTNKDTGSWYIFEENGMLYGQMVSVAGEAPGTKAYGCKGKKTPDVFPVKGPLEENQLTGTRWIYSLKKIAEGKWANGYVLDPSCGSNYKCKITYHPAADGKAAWLEMRGEIGAGIGRSQRWRAATKEQAMAVK